MKSSFDRLETKLDHGIAIGEELKERMSAHEAQEDRTTNELKACLNYRDPDDSAAPDGKPRPPWWGPILTELVRSIGPLLWVTALFVVAYIYPPIAKAFLSALKAFKTL